MCWWTKALYDTCSLITLDNLLLDHPGLEGHFSGVLALERSFAPDQMRSDAMARMRARGTVLSLPNPATLAGICAPAGLSRALAEVDILIYAAAVHHGVAVVTEEKRLACSLRQAALKVGNVALILRGLVLSEKLGRKNCEVVLRALARRGNLLLGNPDPTWPDLECYRFPK